MNSGTDEQHAQDVQPDTEAQTTTALPREDADRTANDQQRDGEQQTLEILSPADASSLPQDDDEAEVQIALRNLERRRAERKRKKLIKIGIACAVVLALVGFLVGRSILSGSKEEETSLETAVVERGNYENVISGSGALKAGSSVIVTPEVDGIIESLSVTEGQHVNEGDVLFTIKNDSYDRKVHEAQQDVTSAQQALDAAQRGVGTAEAARDEAWSKYQEAWDTADAEHADWQYLKDNYSTLHAEWEQRSNYANSLACGEPLYPGDSPTIDPDKPEEKALYDAWEKAYAEYLVRLEAWDAYQDALELVGEEPTPAGAEPKYPDAPDDVSLAAAIQSAQDSVTTASLALSKANDAYNEAVKEADKRVVKAPASGNVVALGAKVGLAVGGSSASSGAAASAASGNKSSGEPLVQISDVNKMSVDIEVNEIDIMNVKKGQKAKVTFSAVPDVTVDAKVSEVATVATSAGEGGGVVTFHVGLVIDHPDSKLREGMTASVKIKTTDLKDVLLVPASALTDTGKGFTVQLLVNEETGQTKTREVKITEKNSTNAVVEEGLKEGDVVVLGGGVSMDEADAALLVN